MSADLYQVWGSDLNWGATVDIQPVEGLDMSTQRLLRRLLTNPGDYIWHADYGAGVGRYVGATMAQLRIIESSIIEQVLMETGIARLPRPQVSFQPQRDLLLCTIQYWLNPGPPGPQVLSFEVTG